MLRVELGRREDDALFCERELGVDTTAEVDVAGVCLATDLAMVLDEAGRRGSESVAVAGPVQAKMERSLYSRMTSSRRR